MMNELGEEQQEPTTIQEENRRQPEYCPKKPVTYAILPKVDTEQRNGIIASVQFADWTAPIVWFTNPMSSLRICDGLLHGRLNDALE